MSNVDPLLLQILDQIQESHRDLRDEMRDGFKAINARLDTLNGGQRRNTADIATLQTRTERLEAKGQNGESVHLSMSPKMATALIGGLTVLGNVVLEIVKRQWLN